MTDIPPYTRIEIRETVPMTGTCPMTNQFTEIDVTYLKYHPLGSERAYAIVSGIDCAEADDNCPIQQCPIAHSRVYW